MLQVRRTVRQWCSRPRIPGLSFCLSVRLLSTRCYHGWEGASPGLFFAAKNPSETRTKSVGQWHRPIPDKAQPSGQQSRGGDSATVHRRRQPVLGQVPLNRHPPFMLPAVRSLRWSRACPGPRISGANSYGCDASISPSVYLCLAWLL